MLLVVNSTVYLLILGAFTIAGWKVANSFSRRVVEIQNLISMLHILQTEIVHNRTPLSDAMERIGHSIPGTTGWFALSVNGHLGEMDTAQEAWEKGLENLSAESALLTPEIEALTSLGMVLGLSHTEDQDRHLRLAIVRLERLLEEANLASAKNVRLWRYLGFMGGVMVVILLL